ncbi:hypothetical protein KFL_009210030 [Klebsormidium nitens]|uniref:Uncharacterized protein n=1 Tax=Klebsormidium nitens TaxID=105231 RepID=A0A1Y1IS62_KLENI|nr:hypothetical protein KFL_009210030 [Klebsormidium nitens]|eukprot:GAQ92101.1 hypothetical protein KFL_009210030 [Klebsormidium nitens]
MAGLKVHAGTADEGLQQGFEKVLTCIKQAHLREGLRRPASPSPGAHRTAASPAPAPASPAATNEAWQPAGGASRRARRAREEPASYLFGDKGCNDWQQNQYWWDPTPRSRDLIEKLLIIGGVESNPGPSSIEGDRPLASGGDTPVDDVGAARVVALPPLHNARDGPEDWQHASADQLQRSGSGVGTKRPPKHVPSGAEPLRRRKRGRLVKLSELASRAPPDLAAGNVIELATSALTQDARELEEELEEDLSDSDRNGRRSKERAVADFFAESRQRREAWVAREETMYGPPSSSEQHAPEELGGLETNGAEAGEQEPLGRHSSAPTAPDLVRSQDSEARPSTPVAPKTGRPTSKKRHKRAKPNPVRVDELARAAGRAAVEAHHQTLGALRAPRLQREGQAIHQTELGDFGGPAHAPPVALVTDAPISNVGALAERLQAKRDAEEATARGGRLKRYGRVRPLGVPTSADDPPARTIQDPGALAAAPPSPRVAPPPQDGFSLALSAEQPPPAAPSEPPFAEEEQAPMAPLPSNQPLAADDAPATQQPTPPFFSHPREPPSSAGHPAQDPPSRFLAEELAAAQQVKRPKPPVTAPPPIQSAQPEVVPGQPPTVGPFPSPIHQEQAPVDQALSPDLPNQPPAVDTSQPTGTEPSAEPSTAIPPLEPPAQLLGEPPQAASVGDGGPSWCKKLEEALQQRRANGRAIMVAEDVHQGGAKRYGSFENVAALVAHRRSLGPFAHLYELIQDDACWRVYFDLDFSLPTEDSSDFERRLGAFHLVRDRFLTSVLNIPEGALHFQACKAHGPARPPKQEFKYSVHEVLEGFYLRGLEARRAFGKAFGCFLESPPDDLKASIELLRKENGSAYMWDGSVYGRYRCFRILRSSKFGDRLRSLVPCDGSSEAIADHLVCLYSEAELADSTEISADLLGQWATAQRGPPAPARVGAFRQRALALDEASTSEGLGEDLTEQERAILIARYQEDHAGAQIDRVVQERPGVFFIHFCTPEPTCCIAGRRHTSPGNQNPYLIYKRDEPRIARYQCFANSCRFQEFLFEMVKKEYKVDPSRVDHDFYTRFCADEDDAKRTREAHANYLRFREHRFDALAADLNRALGQANEEGVI